MPYATTLFDDIRRAMPYTSPGSLSADEIYAVSAYILAEGRIIKKSTVLDAKNLLKIEMPTATGSSPIHGRKRSSSNWRDKFGIAGSPRIPGRLVRNAAFWRKAGKHSRCRCQFSAKFESDLIRSRIGVPKTGSQCLDRWIRFKQAIAFSTSRDDAIHAQNNQGLSVQGLPRRVLRK
jgi:hypothetical protein